MTALQAAHPWTPTSHSCLPTEPAGFCPASLHSGLCVLILVLTALPCGCALLPAASLGGPGTRSGVMEG